MVSATIQRLTLSALLSAAIVAIAMLGMMVSSAPRAVSLIVEPLSLLLTPGLILAVLGTGPHDFSPARVVYVSLAFYFALAYLLLTRRAHRRAA